MEPNNPTAKPPPSGSIADTAAHLALWGSLAPRGLGRVVYHSEYARQRVVRDLQAALKESNTPFHQLDLPPFQPAVEVVRFLLDHIKDLEPGVVSIAGFATAFEEDVSLAESLYLLSVNRENLARFPLRQVWWMTPYFADTFIKAVPDLSSWFLVRLRLTEDVPTPRDGRLIFERLDRPALNIDEARRRAASLAERAERAVAAGQQPLADIRRDLALPAVKALYDAGVEHEARAMLTSLALLLRESEEQLGGELGVGSAFPLAMDDQVRLWDLNETAFRLHQLGKFQAAEPLYRRALEICERVFGPYHPATAASLNDLARFYHDMSRYVEAEPLYRKALAIREKALDPDHPDTAASLNDLGVLLRLQGRLEEAEPLLRRALAIREKALGPDHPETAFPLNDLGGLLRSQGRYGEVEPLYLRALEIRQKAQGPDHPDTSRSLNNLAELYLAQGRFKEAEPLLRRALEIREKALDPDHPETASSLNELGVLLRLQGRLEKAEPLLRRALAIREKALGPDHPDTATSFINLALLRQSQGFLEEAEPRLRRALAIREKALGPDHPETAFPLNDLGGLLRSQSRYGEAESLYRRALAIDEKALGPDHPDFATVLENLAELLAATNRQDEADALRKQARAIREKHEKTNPAPTAEEER